MWQLQRCSPGTKFHTGSAIWRLMRWMRLWRRGLRKEVWKGIEIINTLSVRKGGHAVFRETETAEQCRLAPISADLTEKSTRRARMVCAHVLPTKPEVLDRDQTCGCGDYTGGTYGSVGQFLPRTYSCGYLGDIWRKHVP